jgi:hypothetical protein
MAMKRLYLSATICLIQVLGLAQVTVPEAKFAQLFKEGKYDEVYQEALQLRGQPYGRNALVDYFIAKSLCLKGDQDAAIRAYFQIKRNYSLSPKQKKFLQVEFSSCEPEVTNGSEPILAPSNFNYLNSLQLPVASVAGKLGMVFNCYAPLVYSHFDSLMTSDMLKSRLFAIDQKALAAKSIQTMLGRTYTVDTAGRFLVVTLNRQNVNSSQVRTITTQLEKALVFYSTNFDLRLPDKLITVYLMPDNKELAMIAKKVHHLDFPANQLGYSCVGDMSLVGISDETHLGTLYHELFHILIRNDIGNIPAWLDEGLASLYTVSHWQGDQLVGNSKPWRWIELENAAQSADPAMQIPPLKQLINYSWDEFNGYEDSLFNMCKSAVNYSYMNFLMIYLQQKGQLKQLVREFKNKANYGLDTLAIGGGDAPLVESALGIGLDTLAIQYERWLASAQQITIYRRDPMEGLFRSFGEKFDKDRQAAYLLEEFVPSARAKPFQIRLQQLEQEYQQNRSRYESQVAPIRKLLVDTRQTLLPVNKDGTDLDNAIAFYNALQWWEIDARQLVFESRGSHLPTY